MKGETYIIINKNYITIEKDGISAVFFIKST